MTFTVPDAALTAYRQVLGNPALTAQDDFFEFGGDSVQAMDVIAAIEETTGIQVSVGMFFRYPTAAELADAILAEPGPAR